MALRGRKPVAPEIRELTGLKSSHPPANPNPPRLKRPLGGPPLWMTALQKEIWKEGLKSAPANIIREIDAAIYQTWVFAMYSRQRAAEQFEREGGDMIVTTINGNTKQNPLLAIIRQESTIIQRAAAEMGFTPSARMRVKEDGSSEKDPENPFAAFNTAPGSSQIGKSN